MCRTIVAVCWTSAIRTTRLAGSRRSREDNSALGDEVEEVARRTVLHGDCELARRDPGAQVHHNIWVVYVLQDESLCVVEKREGGSSECGARSEVS